MSLELSRLSSADATFEARFEALVCSEVGRDAKVETAVREIVDDVRRNGDAALLKYTAEFDGWMTSSAADLEVDVSRLGAALSRIDARQREALELAAQRIESFHVRQRQESWHYEEADGTRLGQQVTALDRVGVYVPGGQAAYPSTVLMNVLPAKVAGVQEIVMVVPTPDGKLNDLVLAAARIAGVDRVYAIGGAQAIAALAYGTQIVPRVDKIVGPGNIYVATAKRLVFGVVGIDMIAGPSEIVVLCDGSVRPDWIAMDLFSQAEHDADARALALCPDATYLDAVHRAMHDMLPDMVRQDTIRGALRDNGALIEVTDLDEAVALVNRMAPEHLELAVANPDALLSRIRHAGAVFSGAWSSEVLGDYCAGPNHVLPTGRTARFSSPLGVYDFQKRTSVIACSAAGAKMLGQTASVLARGEGLTAHACSAELRVQANEPL